MKNILLLFLVGFLASSGFSQITESHYKIYSVKLGKEVPLNAIADDMKNFDVLIFGEEHNDSVTHYLENKLLELLFERYNTQIALSMEMFDRDVQPVMNEYLRGGIRERNFLKDARSWSNYRDYRPMVEFAKNNKLEVVCANAASRYTNLVGRKGQEALMVLPKESKKNFAPLPFDTASGKYYEKLMGLMSHSMPAITDTSSAKKAPVMHAMPAYNLVMGQSLWDATMAFSIAEYLKNNKKKKVMQVNGRFHSDEKFAIVTQLKKYSPKTKSLVISCFTDESFANIEWSKHQHMGDYIIITDPSVPKTY